MRRYLKLLTGFITLLGLLFVTTPTHKDQVNKSKTSLGEKKDKLKSADKSTKLANANVDDSSHLFVDCTGFFE